MPIIPFTTALKVLKANQKAAVGTSYNHCTVYVNVYNCDKDKEGMTKDPKTKQLGK